MKILIADDNAAIIKTLTKYFKFEGAGQFEVETVSNGAECLSQYDKFKPDVVVLDISMPVMDGKETLTRLLKQDPQAHVVIASAAGSSTTIEECLKKGALGYIEKPYLPEDLVTMIRNSIKLGTDYSKIVTVFSLAAAKMESSLQKMIDNSITVSFNDIKIEKKVSNTVSTYSQRDLSKISIPEVQKDHAIKIPSGAIGIISDISGQQSGFLVSIINKQEIRMLLSGDDSSSELEDEDAIFLELLHILNNNVITEYENFTQQKIVLSSPKYFESNKEMNVTNENQLKVLFNITRNGKSNNLEINIVTN